MSVSLRVPALGEFLRSFNRVSDSLQVQVQVRKGLRNQARQAKVKYKQGGSPAERANGNLDTKSAVMLMRVGGVSSTGTDLRGS